MKKKLPHIHSPKLKPKGDIAIEITGKTVAYECECGKVFTKQLSEASYNFYKQLINRVKNGAFNHGEFY